MKTEHLGSDLDDFLRQENLLDSAEAMAAKRVLAFRLGQAQVPGSSPQKRNP
jgi:hypothetical protein